MEEAHLFNFTRDNKYIHLERLFHFWLLCYLPMYFFTRNPFLGNQVLESKYIWEKLVPNFDLTLHIKKISRVHIEKNIRPNLTWKLHRCFSYFIEGSFSLTLHTFMVFTVQVDANLIKTKKLSLKATLRIHVILWNFLSSCNRSKNTYTPSIHY